MGRSLPDFFNGCIVLQSVSQALGSFGSNLILDKPFKKRKRERKHFALGRLICLRLVCSILSVTHLARASCGRGRKSTLLSVHRTGATPGSGGFWFPSSWLACLESDNPPIEAQPRGSQPLQSKVPGRLSGLLRAIVPLTTQLLSGHSRAAVWGIIRAGSRLLLEEAIHCLP